MQNGVWRAIKAFNGAVDQMFARLGQHLNGDIIRNVPAFDQLAQEVEISVRCRREPDLDFLEPHIDKQPEHAHLAHAVHWLD